jgi:acetoin utilization protein AcuB
MHRSAAEIMWDRVALGMHLRDRMNPVRVYRHMTPSPITIGRDQTLATAHAMMVKHHIRHLPVLDGGALVGIVTERDLRLIESMSGTNPEETLVEEAMTPDPYMVSYDTPLRDVAAAMAQHKYGCAVVMERGHVAGIFTTVDALRALLAFETASTRHARAS